MYHFEETVSSAVPDDGTASESPRAEEGGPLSAHELDALDRYWRAANYLTVGQIYLQDNPLLREPLRSSHVKPRLLGHSKASAYAREHLEDPPEIREWRWSP
jgi:phosphoketolase